MGTFQLLSVWSRSLLCVIEKVKLQVKASFCVEFCLVFRWKFIFGAISVAQCLKQKSVVCYRESKIANESFFLFFCSELYLIFMWKFVWIKTFQLLSVWSRRLLCVVEKLKVRMKASLCHEIGLMFRWRIFCRDISVYQCLKQNSVCVTEIVKVQMKPVSIESRRLFDQVFICRQWVGL